MSISHRKEIRKLTFRGLALRQSVTLSTQLLKPNYLYESTHDSTVYLYRIDAFNPLQAFMSLIINLPELISISTAT